jgi:hypothetical protein
MTKSVRIGHRAEAIFESACRDLGWLPVKTPQEADFGIDYRVEIVDQTGNVGELEFYVQLKGTARSTVTPTIRLKAATANYLRAKLLPVLLVGIEVSARSVKCAWFAGGSKMSIPLVREFPGRVEGDVREYYAGIRAAVMGATGESYISQLLQTLAAISRLVAQTQLDYAAVPPPDRDAQHEAQRRVVLASILGVLDAPRPVLPEPFEQTIAARMRTVLEVRDSFDLHMTDIRGWGVGMWSQAAFEHAIPFLIYECAGLSEELLAVQRNVESLQSRA